MKALCCFTFLCFSISLLYAQNERLFYEYKVVKDSTQKNKVSKEMMLLEVTNQGSVFYSYKKYKRDSTDIAEVRKGSMEGGRRIIGKTSHSLGENNNRVSKTYPDYKVTLHTTIGEHYYRIPEERKITWVLHPEKQKIGEWSAQKATANFAGRQWEAWYTDEIPIPEGPYKFHGLPGLIVKIEDSQKYHSFELKGISKITDNVATASEIYRPTEIELDRKKYRKVFWDDRNDPARAMKQMILNSGGSNVNFMINGNRETDPAKMIKIYENSAKERVKKDNNHLEIDMLVQ